MRYPLCRAILTCLLALPWSSAYAEAAPPSSPTSLPSTEGATPPAQPAASDLPPTGSVTSPSDLPDLFWVSLRPEQGWRVGDRVRLERGGQALGEATLVVLDKHHAQVLVLKTPASPIKTGDAVVFLRHRKLPPSSSLSKSPSSVGRSTTPGAGSPYGSPGSELAGASTSAHAQTDWREVGTVKGLAGTDWMSRDTTYCRVYVPKGNLEAARSIVDTLDASAEYNTRFMGLAPPARMTFYFCPLDTPGHKQPGFTTLMARYTRAAGVAFSSLNAVIVNLGNWRTGQYSNPLFVEQVCRHEMNHLFAYQVRGADRQRTWSWLYEALAHTAEDTVNPTSMQMDVAGMKAYMAGYKAADANFNALIDDRNNDELEQYRDYRKLLMSVIFYLQDRYGSDVIARLIPAARGRDIEDALVAITGKGERELEAEWKEFYGLR